MISVVPTETILVSAGDACPYLQGRCASTEYRIAGQISPSEYEGLLERGWRRFGPFYFRQVCDSCAECVALRIPVADFQPTKSQRRTLRKVQSKFTVEVGNPRLNEARLELYRRWHADRETTRSWPANTLNAVQYNAEFCFPNECALEMAWHYEGRLMAVDLVDRTPATLNSIFFFYDPAFARYSPGAASILYDIEWARAAGISHVYLGYRVSGCPSMSYKAQFRPHEILQGRPSAEERPVWTESGAEKTKA